MYIRMYLLHSCIPVSTYVHTVHTVRMYVCMCVQQMFLYGIRTPSNTTVILSKRDAILPKYRDTMYIRTYVHANVHTYVCL